MTSNVIKTKKRIVIVFIIICLVFMGLTLRVGWVQIVKGEEYEKLATKYQTQDIPISPKRGSIYDRNGKELAISGYTYSIWVTPGLLQNPKIINEIDQEFEQSITLLSSTLEIDREALRSLILEDSKRKRIAKYIDKETADKIKKEGILGIDIQEDIKRFYPLGAFASHVLGSVTDDNKGLFGIELKYDYSLTGTPGRWIKNVDVKGNSLSYGVEKYYRPEDGLSLVLTIDEVIQHFTEKALEKAVEKTQARAGYAIVMEVETGEILSMAAFPDYDPNNPRQPIKEEEAAYVEGLTTEEKMVYWNSMWRNPMISNTFEPGSTLKLITTAIGLEEGLTSLDEEFYCDGYYTISGVTLKCWRYYNPHLTETLSEAVGNSCNPVFIELSERIGYDMFYTYLNSFGITKKTGIDYPGEAYSIIQSKEAAGPVGLATMSYGQGIAVTPINLITAISSFGNEGRLMEPRLVKGLLDDKGNFVKEFKPKVVRSVVSAQTANEIGYAMEQYVEAGASGTKITGYRIGAKTGTANKPISGGYSTDTDSSAIALAPMEDPKVSVLVVIDSPKGVQYGSATASPAVKEILENTLRYLNVKPSYNQEDESKISEAMLIVPSITGMKFTEAITILEEQSLNYTITPELSSNEDFIIIDQYPKPGEKISKEGMVFIYRK